MKERQNSLARAAEIKRLLDRGQYRIDPIQVAEAMIRRGHWELDGRRPPWLIVPAGTQREPS